MKIGSTHTRRAFTLIELIAVIAVMETGQGSAGIAGTGAGGEMGRGAGAGGPRARLAEQAVDLLRTEVGLRQRAAIDRAGIAHDEVGDRQPQTCVHWAHEEAIGVEEANHPLRQADRSDTDHRQADRRETAA